VAARRHGCELVRVIGEVLVLVGIDRRVEILCPRAIMTIGASRLAQYSRMTSSWPPVRGSVQALRRAAPRRRRRAGELDERRQQSTSDTEVLTGAAGSGRAR